MTTRRSPSQRLGQKSGATNFSAPAPEPSDRFTQLSKQMAENRDSTNRDVQQELRRFRYGIEEIYKKRFDELVCTSDPHEAELVELRRQGELGSAPSPPLNQQAGNGRFPIPIYS